MDKETVGIDYEYRCRCLEEEINRLKEENDIKFNLDTEKIYTDFQIYKFINKKLAEVLEKRDEDKCKDILQSLLEKE